jgi:hypothetical protein
MLKTRLYCNVRTFWAGFTVLFRFSRFSACNLLNGLGVANTKGGPLFALEFGESAPISGLTPQWFEGDNRGDNPAGTLTAGPARWRHSRALQRRDK